MINCIYGFLIHIVSFLEKLFSAENLVMFLITVITMDLCYDDFNALRQLRKVFMSATTDERKIIEAVLPTNGSLNPSKKEYTIVFAVSLIIIIIENTIIDNNCISTTVTLVSLIIAIFTKKTCNQMYKKYKNNEVVKNTMSGFIKGMDLCEGFFNEYAKPIIEENFPDLKYSAGLIGYGSDVLGYDDPVSTDHMWGPRFFLFLSEADISKKSDILETLSENLPYTYKGYSVNFTEPDPNDCGVQHPEFITEGKVNPLVFIHTFDEYLNEQLGTADLDNISPFQWLAFSEHRLLSLVSGKFFVDGLNCSEKIAKIKYYPAEVKLYMIASNWDIIASEQAFAKRCGECGDDIGSRLVCARIAERLMRLCFLYKDAYAPYSKWFGTAFSKLDIDDRISQTISNALSADTLTERENKIVKAQALVADMHNESGLTDYVDYKIESYFGRDIKVIFADKFSNATVKELKNTAFENTPLIGTLSQIGGLSSFADEKEYYKQIMKIYGE